MRTQACVKAHTPTARKQAGALRRVASVCLLLGWGAFWLIATLQPCCKLSVAALQPVSAAAVSHSAAFDHSGDADHRAPDSGDICADITIAARTALTTAAHSFGGAEQTSTYPACVTEEGYAVRQTNYAIEYPPLPPSHPLTFYQRSSRILI